jgi:Zn-finger protein
MSDNYKFFQHKDCEYFPCHKGVDAEDFNCLFCYCPLYFLGRECGGSFTYTKKGVKNCMGCSRPHRRENYEVIIDRLREAMRVSAKDCPVEADKDK